MIEGYGEVCAGPAAEEEATPAVLGPEELRDRLAGPTPPVLVDVRDDWEVAIERAQGREFGGYFAWLIGAAGMVVLYTCSRRYVWWRRPTKPLK